MRPASDSPWSCTAVAQLGNCWFMCSLGALCEFRARRAARCTPGARSLRCSERAVRLSGRAATLVDQLFVQAWSQDEESGENRSEPKGHYELRFCTSGQCVRRRTRGVARRATQLGAPCDAAARRDAIRCA